LAPGSAVALIPPVIAQGVLKYMKKSVQAGRLVNVVEYRFSKYEKDIVTTRPVGKCFVVILAFCNA
jgi:hypothetical protein